MNVVLKPWQTIRMPDGSQICLASSPGEYTRLRLFEQNHNLFRLGDAGNVIWQVTRDEGEYPGWAKDREKAEAEDSADHSVHSPFSALILRFADGTRNVDPLTGNGPPTARWVEGSTVLCGTLDGQLYELDVDKGVALNKTPLGIRLW